MRLTSPDKVLWPGPGFTKRDLWDYVEHMAERLLPQLAARPLTLKRFPNGLDGEGFFQKHLPDRAPDWLTRHRVWTPTSQRHVAYLVADDVAALRWCAQQAALELHPWCARVDRPERADLLAFDLDPGPAAYPVARAAWSLREVLDDLGLACLVKTSGKRGLHVIVPLERRYDYAELRGFALALGRACVERHPDVLTVEMRKADRGERLLIDWSRAGPAQTLAAAWSPRAHPAGTVATPLAWEEVTDDLDPTAFTLASAPQRPDPWAQPPAPQRIERARRALAEAGYPAEDRSPRARTTPR